MDMTETERALMAQRVRDRRASQFGTRSAAYREAGLNSATWKRIEAGDPVREDRMVAAVKALWPGTGGDWRKVADAEPVDQPAVGSEQWLMELQDRVEALERIITDSTEQESDQHGRESTAIIAAASAAAEKEAPTRASSTSLDVTPQPAASPTPEQRRPRRARP